MLPALLAAARDSALDEIEALRLQAEVDGEGDRQWTLRHSLHVIRTFPDVRQALRQLRGHADFVSLKVKSDAYREAFAILTRHTGETPAETRPRHDLQETPCLF